MKRFYGCFFLLCLTLLQLNSFAQTVTAPEIRGLVTDSESGETLPFANVFFAGTTYGTISDRNGKFRLKPYDPGTYELVISFLGYKTYRRQVDLNKPGMIQLEVKLEPESSLLSGVTVTAKKEKRWKKNLKAFKKTFLGTSVNARDCKILNEEVLYFDYDKEDDILQAYADEPLIIENRALGYEIKYLLEDFKLLDAIGYFTFRGYPSFKELEADDKEAEEWKQERVRAYMGSKSHFYRTLYEGNTTDAGFQVSEAKLMNGEVRVFIDSLFDVNSLVKLNADGIRKELVFDEFIHIRYKDEAPEKAYLETLSPDVSDEVSRANMQVSWFDMPKNKNKVIFEKSGYWVNKQPFTLRGYWGFEKIADMVPFDYVPERNEQ